MIIFSTYKCYNYFKETTPAQRKAELPKAVAITGLTALSAIAGATLLTLSTLGLFNLGPMANLNFTGKIAILSVVGGTEGVTALVLTLFCRKRAIVYGSISNVDSNNRSFNPSLDQIEKENASSNCFVRIFKILKEIK